MMLGVVDGEIWTDAKQLFIALDESIMLPYTELASLECFALWRADEAGCTFPRDRI